MSRSLAISIALAAISIRPQFSFATDAHFQAIWSLQHGGSGNDWVTSAVTDQDENVIVAGRFSGTTSFGGASLVSAGSDDIFVAKYDPDGAHLWSMRFGSTSLELARAVAVDMAGNVYVAGEFRGSVDFGNGVLTSAGSGDAFVASYTPAGDHRWSRRFGSPDSDNAQSLAMTSSGNLVIGGSYRGHLDLGGGVMSSQSFDTFVLVLDAGGAYIWSAGYGTDVWELTHDVAVDNDNNVYVVVESARVTVLDEDDERTHVVKYDDTGSQVWARVPELWGYDNGPGGAAVDSQGNLIVGGWLRTCLPAACNSFVIKLSPAGDSIWDRRFPDAVPSIDRPYFSDIVVDEADRIVLTGLIQGGADLGGGPLGDTGDLFLARFDADGNHEVSVGFAGAFGGHATYLAPTPSDDLLLAGTLYGTIDFGNGVLSSTGPDVVVARFDVDVALAVAIRAFSAKAVANVVELQGEFQSDLRVNAVNVYRAEGSGSFDRIESIVHVAGGSFSYMDRSVQPGHSYRYMIGVVDDDGEFFSPVAYATTGLLRGKLLQNTPNPFNPTTTISFVLPERAHTSLVVYDASGRVVRVLVDEVRDYGRHDAVWDGRNQDGAVVASGVFFYRLSVGSFADTKKMLLLK